LRYLARREHSRDELARKLAPHAESPELLEALLRELESRKQLSNQRFAEVRANWLARKYGAARIRHDLKSKGVSEEVSDRAVAELDDTAKAKEILARKYRTPATKSVRNAPAFCRAADTPTIRSAPWGYPAVLIFRKSKRAAFLVRFSRTRHCVERR